MIDIMQPSPFYVEFKGGGYYPPHPTDQNDDKHALKSEREDWARQLLHITDQMSLRGMSDDVIDDLLYLRSDILFGL